MSSSRDSSLFFPDSLRFGDFVPAKNNGAINSEGFLATNQEATMTVTEVKENGIHGMACGVHIYISSFACRAAGLELSEGLGQWMYAGDAGLKVAVGDEILVKILVMRKEGVGKEFHAIAGISWTWVDFETDRRANKGTDIQG